MREGLIHGNTVLGRSSIFWLIGYVPKTWIVMGQDLSLAMSQVFFWRAQAQNFEKGLVDLILAGHHLFELDFLRRI